MTLLAIKLRHAVTAAALLGSGKARKYLSSERRISSYRNVQKCPSITKRVDGVIAPVFYSLLWTKKAGMFKVARNWEKTLGVLPVGGIGYCRYNNDSN
jgi:hypothetical protein